MIDRLKRLFGGSPSNGVDDAPGDAESARCAAGQGVTCEEALILVHEYLDGELGDVPQSKVQEHFEVCGRCYPHLRFEEAFRTAMRRVALGQAAPPELKAKIAELLAEVDREA